MSGLLGRQPMSWKALWELLRDSYAEWKEDRASRLAAALAYYALFSLGPVLLIAISIAGLVFGQEAATGQVVENTEALIGRPGAEAVQTMLAATSQTSSSALATAVGVVTLVLGAAGMFGQLQDALNTVWDVEPRPRRGLIGTVRDKLASFAMVLGSGFLLLLSLVASALLVGVVDYFGSRLGSDHAGLLLHAADFVLSFFVVTVLFAALFKLLPDVDVAWGDVWPGAAFTAFLFTVGELAIGLYLGRASVGSAYGAAGSLVVLLFWVYYSAQILFFGAEFTQVYSNRYGSRKGREVS